MSICLFDSGSVGTCWAFSTVQNVEGQWALKSQALTNLSVEQVVDCDGMQKPDSFVSMINKLGILFTNMFSAPKRIVEFMEVGHSSAFNIS